jgi:hypothetical protein
MHFLPLPQRVAIIPGAREELAIAAYEKAQHTGSHAPLCHHVIMHPS